MIICKQCGHPNADGATFCKNSECGAFLEWTGERVRTEMVPAVELERKGKAAVTASLSETDLTAEPGGEVTIEVRVANKGRVVDQVTLHVGGETSRWAAVQPDRINLLPGTEDVARITFALPRAGVVAGPRPFRVEAVSGEDPAARAAVDGTLTVRSYHELTAKLTPRTAETRRRASYQVVLANHGNTAVRARLSAEDENGSLSFAFSAPELHLGPGEERAGALDVVTRQQHRGQAAQTHRFRVQVQPDTGNPLELDGELTDLPVPPAVTKGRLVGLRVLLTLLGVLLMFGGAQMSWLDGVSGVDLTYDQYVNEVFDANAEAPPDEVPTVAASVGLPAIVLGILAALGLLGSKGRLTKTAAVLSMLLFVAFAITLSQAGFSVGSGVIVVILGSLVALVGGFMANAARAKAKA